MENKLLNTDGDIITIEESTLKKLNELRVLAKQSADELKSLSTAISNELRKLTCDKPIKVSDYNLVKKGGNYTYEFDLEKLISDFPEIYDQCLKQTQEKITFSLVYAKREKKGEK